ncbi:MAG: 1,5-anhydro-D-fructose reductase [Smithella sp. PtaU1.Bin162]|nr:MAG: 1,5-anhydro-D-fructose reductase [Smithella sp. PtaU1.Bin162]
MGKNTLKILMIGLGSIGQRHVRNLRQLLGENVEITAYRSRKRPYVLTEQAVIEQGSNLEEKYNIQLHENIDEAMGQKPDAVFICNPPDLHVSTALKAAQNGLNLFIEKPLSHTYEHVDELIKLIEQRNLVALVGYQMRFHPCLRKLESLIKAKAIGTILSVRAELGEYLPGFHPYEDYRHMHESHQARGGGVVISQIHELDYLYWLFGLPKRVFAVGGHLSNLEIDAEDTASILMEYRIEGKTVPVHLQQDFTQRPASRTCQVIGNEGKILVDLRALTVNVFNSQGEFSEINCFEGFQRNQLFLDELNHFLECLQRKQTPHVTVHDGAQSLQMALAAKKSLASGQVVEMEHEL